MVTGGITETLTLSTKVREESGVIAANIAELLQACDRPPSPSHLSGLIASLAWHQRRPTPALRLGAFRDELKRLNDKMGASPEGRLYADLRQRIGPERTEDDWRVTVIQPLLPDDVERDRWEATLDFMLALAIVQILQTTARGAVLRAELAKLGGSVQ